ncbi:MAG TPA: hypothetical protein PKV88_00835 [Bacteroidales bacterium]|jgi:hypothetical protein|nr:hypothetical protein [Bacteroidales bacterium]MDD4086900.1 hypothetical protein [Bacteroidales bacterium]MDY0085285.1 hypothetical protein [Bacteroidales bacterium]HPE42598.1 hypothetical protein [Bacteroidales bacterium]
MRKIQFIIAVLIGMFSVNMVQAQDDLSPERKQAIDSLALEKVRDLSKYISIIGSKTTPWSEANRVIDRADELFMAGAEIGVSSISRPEVAYYKVRQYFERLMRLNYDRVEIEWFKIEYVSDLQRQPDGTYVGVITIFQKFKGYDKEGGLVYEDTTKKDITVYVKRKETQIGGRIIGFWDVLLGDMRVKETSK